MPPVLVLVIHLEPLRWGNLQTGAAADSKHAESPRGEVWEEKIPATTILGQNEKKVFLHRIIFTRSLITWDTTVFLDAL